MQAQLYATFRVLAGVKRIEVDLPEGATLHDLVLDVVRQAPVLRSHWLDEAGELHAHVHIFLDGEDAQNLPLGMQTPLRADTVVDFFPPVGGG